MESAGARKVSRILAVVLAAAASAQAQVCVERLTTWGGPGDDWGGIVGVDANGNRYLQGVTESFGAGGQDYLLSCFAQNDAPLWVRTWGGAGADELDFGAMDGTTGTLYAAGASDSFGGVGNDAILLKYDTTGQILWARRWDASADDHADSAAVDTTAQVVYEAGGSRVGVFGDALILKYGANGTLLWQKSWGGALDDSFNGIALVSGSPAGFFAGNTQSAGLGNYDALLMKVSSAGNLIWTRTWGTARYDDAWGVYVNSANGDLFMVGETDGFTAPGNTDALITKWDANGNLLVEYTWGGAGADGAGFVGFGAGGVIYVMGSTTSFGLGGEDGFLLVLNANLQLTAAYTFGGTGLDGLISAVQSGSSLLTAGGTSSGALLVPCAVPLVSVTGGVTQPNLPLADAGGAAHAITGAVSSPAGTCGGGLDVALLTLDLAGQCAWTSYCGGQGCPCGNDDAGAGCANSTGLGASLTASGTASVGADDLVLSVSRAPANKNGILFMAHNQIALPLGDGLLCANGGVKRMAVQNGGTCGAFARGPGIAALMTIVSGQTWNFQAWYRDPNGPCAQGTNMSNAVHVVFTP